MQITIENLLGVKHARIDLEGIVEVRGPNASGKTSIATVAQALLTHDANPLGLPATQTKAYYPHNGDTDGYAEIEGVSWRPGKGGMTVTTGVQPYARPEAVGLVDYTARRGEKERLESLQSALLPDAVDIVDAIQERLQSQLPARDLNAVLELISERGFDAAESIYTDRGREAKRQWTEATGGQRYGVKIAADWRPDGWLADMDSMTVGEAEEAVTAAREQLSVLHQVQAISEAEAEEAASAREALPGLQQQLAKTQEDLGRAHAEVAGVPLRAAQQEVEVMERKIKARRDHLLGDPSWECPHCQGRVVWNAEKGILEEYDTERVEAFQAEQRTEIATLETQLAEQLKVVEEHRAAHLEQQKVVDELKKAEQGARTAVAVAEKAAAKAGGTVDSEDRRAAVAQAEQVVDDAKKTAEMVKAEARATELAETIARYAEVVRCLGPQGVRATMMEQGLRKLNAGLGTLAAEAEWPLTAVSDKGAVLWDDRPVSMCSESERWRAQAAIQLTLAAITGSQAVVLDRADLLDASNRKGLERAVKRVAGRTGMAVLLCSTGEADGDAPWPQVSIAKGVTNES